MAVNTRPTDFPNYPGRHGKREKKLLETAMRAPNVGEGIFTRQLAKAVYDFASDTGTVAAHKLGVTLPANSVVTAVHTHVLTAPTSGGSATIEILAGSTSLVAATAIADVTGAATQTLAGTSVTSIAVSSASELTLTVAVAALTAGKVVIVVDFYTTEAA